MNPNLMIYAIRQLNKQPTEKPDSTLSLLEQYKLYMAISGLKQTPHCTDYRDGLSYDITDSGLKISVSEPAYARDYDDDTDCYNLHIESNGTYKHIPKNYHNNGLLARFVFGNLNKRYQQIQKQQHGK